MSISMPTAIAPRNGDTHHNGPGGDPRTDQSLQVPSTGTRAVRYRRAATQICVWEPRYEGMSRIEGLRHVVRRIAKELDVAAEDYAVLIARNLPQHPQPFTTEEIKDACRDVAGGVKPLKGGGLAPRVNLPAPSPQIQSPIVEEMRKREQVPELRGTMLCDVKERPLQWFWQDYVARGSYTMVTGRQGTGKSTFFTGMAAMAKRTIWLCGEERLGTQVKARCKAHGIDEQAVEFFVRDDGLSFPGCTQALTRRINATGTDLVVIDPLTAFLGHAVDCNINEQMQPILQGLDEIAERTNAAVLVCLHPGKAANNSIRGASVFGTHPRVILEVQKHDGPPKRRLITNPKGNLIGEQPAVEFFADDVGGIRVFRLGERLDQQEAQFAQEVPDRLERLIVNDCADWLHGMLSEGPKLRKAVMSSAKDEGYAGRTVERAADKIGIVKERGNMRAGEGSTWKLPDYVEPNPFVDPPPPDAVGG